MAAGVIVKTAPAWSRVRLAAYAGKIEARYGSRGGTDLMGRIPSTVRHAAARVLLHSSWLTRRVILEEGFLHMRSSPYLAH
jgi:hypothetical protein